LEVYPTNPLGIWYEIVYNSVWCELGINHPLMGHLNSVFTESCGGLGDIPSTYAALTLDGDVY
jgi:hypothetical protein